MSLSEKPAPPARPIISRSPSMFNNGAGNGFPAAPASWALPAGRDAPSRASNAVLELSDGSAFQGISFGATDKSVAGECVFQTGESSLGALDSSFRAASTFFARLYESFAYTCIYSAIFIVLDMHSLPALPSCSLFFSRRRDHTASSRKRAD